MNCLYFYLKESIHDNKKKTQYLRLDKESIGLVTFSLQ